MNANQAIPFINSYTYGFCEKQGFTNGQTWKWSMEEMVRTTHCNALVLPVCAWQDHAYSTTMTSVGPDVMDADDVRRVCEHARSLGLKVILKAMVNCRDGYWRAYIRFFDSPVPTEPRWEDWFASWEDHVCRVAAMAEENHADLFCTGCEMVGTDHRDVEWRHLIARVRTIYHGPITYNCDKFQEDHVRWWDRDITPSRNFASISPGLSRQRRPSINPSCLWNAAVPHVTAAHIVPMTGGTGPAPARRNRPHGIRRSFPS